MPSRSPAPWCEDISPFAFLSGDDEWLSGSSSRVEFLVQLPLAVIVAVVSGALAFALHAWLGATIGFLAFAFAGLVGASLICTVLVRRAHDIGLATGAAALFLPPVFALHFLAENSALVLGYVATLSLGLALLPRKSLHGALPLWATWQKSNY